MGRKRGRRIGQYSYPPPSLENKELVGLFAGILNSEGWITCHKQNNRLYPSVYIAMDSESALKKIEPLTNVPTTRIWRAKRKKYQYRQVAIGSRACILVNASKHLLSDEKLKQFEDVSKRCPRES